MGCERILLCSNVVLILPASWGYPFLYESYLYHIHRLDHRHNFSPYFYQTYLSYPSLDQGLHDSTNSLWIRTLRSPLASFAPQMVLSFGLGLMFGKTNEDLPFTWFVQTVVFVIFNKVCTSQVCQCFICCFNSHFAFLVLSMVPAPSTIGSA